MPLTSIVSGKIIWKNIKNNNQVTKGDTLLKIAKEGLETEKKTTDTLSNAKIRVT